MIVSVIIPVYKVEQYLDQCVESVVNQTYRNLEIILVDDGSPDSCPEKCEAWAMRDDRIKVIHKVNGGLSSARNAGLDIMIGDSIFFIDSDDCIDFDTIELLVDEMIDNHMDIVATHFTTDIGHIDSYSNIVFEQGGNELFYLQKITNHACGKLYKATLFKDIRFPNGRTYEDIATTHLVYMRANKVSYTEKGLYFYRIHSNTITANLNVNNLFDMVWAYESVKNTYPNEPLYDFYLLTILYAIYSRVMRASKQVRIKSGLENYIRTEFFQIEKRIHLNEFRGKSPMYLKIFAYKWHLSGVLIKLIDCMRKWRNN